MNRLHPVMNILMITEIEGKVFMKLLRGLITGGGIAAYFFFSWILKLLWNGVLAELQLVPTLITYWQSAGLWLFVIILFAWVGIGNPSGFGKKWRKFDCL
jgi:hypothetical protein